MNERMRKAVVWVMIAGFAAMVALGIGAAFWRGRGKLPPLAKADRAPLVDTMLAGHRVLKHPTLGFSFRHPGDTFAESPEVVSALRASQPDLKYHFYGYRNAEQSEVITIALVNERVDSRDEMQRQLHELEVAMQKGASRSGLPSLEIVSDGVLWVDGAHEARLHALQGDTHFHVRVLASSPKGHPPVIVAFMTLAADAQAMTDVVDSLAP